MRLTDDSVAAERLGRWIQDNHLLDPTCFQASLLPDHPREAALLCAVRWLLSNGHHQQALSLLARVREEADQGEWYRAVIETWLLEAQARSDDTPAAVSALRKALELAAGPGYLQVVLDELPWLTPVFKVAKDILFSGLPPAFCSDLAQALKRHSQLPSVPGFCDRSQASTRNTTASHLTEALTEREIEVLEAIAEGLTNGEAGRRLFISGSTVKKHLENIYGKLNVHNRVEAIARCRALGLLTRTGP